VKNNNTPKQVKIAIPLTLDEMVTVWISGWFDAEDGYAQIVPLTRRQAETGLMEAICDQGLTSTMEMYQEDEENHPARVRNARKVVKAQFLTLFPELV
jgi:hypothetical protein